MSMLLTIILSEISLYSLTRSHGMIGSCCPNMPPTISSGQSFVSCSTDAPPRIGSVSWSRMIGLPTLRVAASSFLQLPEKK